MQNNVRNQSAFSRPYAAEIKTSGTPITVLACGDVEGHSPSLFTVDAETGEATWTPLSDVRFTDSQIVRAKTPQMAGAGTSKR